MINYSQITEWCHTVIASTASKEGFYIDATMGKGNDTLFFCEFAGVRGRVLAFDIQEEALAATEERLVKSGYVPGRTEASRIRLVLDGHEHMDRYAEDETVDVVCFNFGYLPGGDHRIATRPETSILAIEKGLRILKHGGMMSLCIYSGGDTGFEEKDRILDYLKKIPSGEYTVIVNEYYNRGNHPPMPVFVYRR